MLNYKVEQIDATVLTYGDIRVRIDHMKSMTRGAPAVYKVTFTSTAIHTEIRNGASINKEKLQEAIKELDAEIKAITELFILGEDGLKEKTCNSNFSLGEKDFKEMASLMTKKAAKPIRMVEPTFEATNVAVVPSAVSETKPVVSMEFPAEKPIPQDTTKTSSHLASRNDFLAWMAKRNAHVSSQKPSLKVMNQTMEERGNGKAAFSEKGKPVGEKEEQRKDETCGHHIEDHAEEPSEKHAGEEEQREDEANGHYIDNCVEEASEKDSDEEENDEPVYVLQRYIARRKVSPLLRPALSGLEESVQQIKSR
jgi:hypothetical protein